MSLNHRTAVRSLSYPSLALPARIGGSLLAGAIALLLAQPSQATNGFIPHAFSPSDKGLAGAGVAFSQDALAAGSNPAGMVFVGNRLDFAADVFSPSRSYTSTGNASAGFGTPTGGFSTTPSPDGFPTFSIGPQSIDSENSAFLIPSFGWNRMLDEQSSVGISIFGAGGMNTEYKGGTATLFNPQATADPFFVTLPGTFGAGTAGVNYEVLFAGATYARKLNEQHAIGVTGVFALGRFEAQGLGNFAGFSTDPANLSDRGAATATGFGIGLGWQAHINERVSLGASYQSKIDMSEYDEYAGLFADGGDFDIPSWFNLGIAVAAGPGRVVADVQRINYSDAAAVSNPVASLFPPPFGGSCVPGDGQTPANGAGCLGGSEGAGFGWDDITVLKLGYQWSTSDAWTWRVGFSHTGQPIPDSEVVFNILAPGVVEDHLTFGFTHERGNAQWHFNLMHALNSSVSGTSTFDQGQQIELEMDQFQIGLGFTKKL